MKAINIAEFGPPEVMKIVECPKPQPGQGEILVRVHAAGVNPLETYLRAGTAIGNYLPRLPYRPGSEAAGVVEEVGFGVTGIRVGERVYGQVRSGSYAEYAVMREEDAQQLPDHLSFAQGSAISGPYRAAYLALHHLAQAAPGETVLVHGASGSVGTAAIQIARAPGLSVIGTASSEKGRARIIEEGAHFAVQHGEEGGLDEAVRLNGGRPIDVILEMNASSNLGCDIQVMAPGGRIVVIGGQGNVVVDPVAIIGSGLKILGLSIPLTPQPVLQSANTAIKAGLENRSLRPGSPQEIPLREAHRAHQAFASHSARDRFALIP